MNVVISGPFGVGSLADEALLAGFLLYLKSAKHEITVLSSDPDNVEELHDVPSLKLTSPNTILSAPKVWSALSKAHLFVVAGAGVVNEKGTFPARYWLGQAEHARRAGPRTATMCLGALPIADPKERVRVQRQLHNFTDYISVRDPESKAIVIGYGISATRVSFNGDFTLALSQQKIAPVGSLAQRIKTVGVLITKHFPTRSEFGVETGSFSEVLMGAYHKLLASLLERGLRIRLFHDDTDEARAAAAVVCNGLDANPIDHPDRDDDIETVRERMAGCGVLFSPSLHGLVLAATCSVPVVGLAAEPGATYFLTSLGLADHALSTEGGVFDASAVCEFLVSTLASSEVLSGQIALKVVSLARKQTQDARTLELLVPRRDRRPPRDEDEESDDDGSDIVLEDGTDVAAVAPRKTERKSFDSSKRGFGKSGSGSGSKFGGFGGFGKGGTGGGFGKGKGKGRGKDKDAGDGKRAASRAKSFKKKSPGTSAADDPWFNE